MSLMREIHLCKDCERKFRPKALVEVVIVDTIVECVFGTVQGFNFERLSGLIEVR